MRLSRAEYDAILVRMHNSKASKESIAPKSGVSREKDLHAAILDECKRRGWIAFHSRMDRRTGSTLGMPDFIVMGSRRFAAGSANVCGESSILYGTQPATWMIECKTAKGKLSTAQLGLQAWAKKLGHPIHVVRSMEEFLNLIESK